MAITDRKITTYAKNIVDLPDRPSEGGYTATTLKAFFDGRGDEEIKTSINGIVDDLVAVTDGTSGADQVGATKVGAGTAETVQGILEEIHGLDATNAHLTGNETIAGVKTFSSSPIVPTPTTDMQSATKKYADDGLALKVPKVDIVNGLTETVTGKVLDATQGKVLKDLVDANNNNLEQKYLSVIPGKNMYNHSLSVSGRLYTRNVGTVQTSETSTTQVWQKIVISPDNNYAVQEISAYVITDINNVVLVVRTAVGSGESAVITELPVDTYYLWIESNTTMSETLSQVEVGDSVTRYEAYNSHASAVVNEETLFNLPAASASAVTDIDAILGRDLSTVTSVVDESMSISQFITAFNGAMPDYAILNKCYTESFQDIPAATADWNTIYEMVNHNLREDIALSGKTLGRICDDINHKLTKPIRRFCDAKIGSARDFSLATSFQAGEPSAIVSSDGNTLYIYAYLKRVETTDGLNWSEPTSLVLSDSGNILHCNVNLIDGVYYLTGARLNTAGDLVLYTSTDGVNFTYQGILFKTGYAFAESCAVTDWGNPYLIKEYGSGKFYIYIEHRTATTTWVMSLATCTDIAYSNEDGTIGNWVNATNPILTYPMDDYGGWASSAGNPDFAKLSDNRPVCVDGKYYMYFHCTWKAIAHIMRAYSEDLMSWTSEGVIFDNRDQPTGGDATSGNADHCIIEFKGRTYLFYTWDINNAEVDSYIKYTIDDRPIRELLTFRP